MEEVIEFDNQLGRGCTMSWRERERERSKLVCVLVMINTAHIIEARARN